MNKGDVEKKARSGLLGLHQEVCRVSSPIEGGSSAFRVVYGFSRSSSDRLTAVLDLGVCHNEVVEAVQPFLFCVQNIVVA